MIKQMNTFTGKHRAVVKETKQGSLYIAFELMDSEESRRPDKAEIGMLLDKETNWIEANNIAETINEKMIGLFITNF